MATRVPLRHAQWWYRGPGDKVQSFLLSVLTQMLLPLVPLLVEKLVSGSVESKGVGLIAGMWVISLALTSEVPVILVSSLVVGIILVAALGVADSQPGVTRYNPNLAALCMLGTGFLFVAERVYKHIVVGEPCPPFERE